MVMDVMVVVVILLMIMIVHGSSPDYS